MFFLCLWAVGGAAGAGPSGTDLTSAAEAETAPACDAAADVQQKDAEDEDEEGAGPGQGGLPDASIFHGLFGG